jgi:uncharacterized SAM-binding protein YcdF (DUF218 family)
LRCALVDHLLCAARRLAPAAWRANLQSHSFLAVLAYRPLARIGALVQRYGGSPNAIPLSYYRHSSLYTMRTDALDRFGTRLEKRFTRRQIAVMLESAGLSKIRSRDAEPGRDPPLTPPVSFPPHRMRAAAKSSLSRTMPDAAALSPRRALAPALLALLLAGLAALAWSERVTIGEMLLHRLEQRFPAWRGENAEPVAGIIALGGSFNGRRSPGERVTAATTLAHRFPSAKVVFSGVEETAGGADPVESFTAAGIERGRIVVEGRSRTTWQNSAFSRALLHPARGQRWILITSAFHMPRAVSTFRAAGFSVEAYPVEYLSVSAPIEAQIAFKEAIGLAYYRLTGRGNAFWPGPDE